MTALQDFSSLSIGTRSRVPVPVSPELEPNKKKYNALEPALQEIHKATALSSKDKNDHNSVLHTTIDEIVDEMKKADPLFKILYNKKFYGGSYYDGLKLHCPDEYDLDLALKLPPKLNPRLEISDVDGFVRIYVNLESIKQEIYYKDFRAMEKFVDKNYLLTNRFREWFEAVLNKAKNNLIARNGQKFDLSKSGPAMTLKIRINGKQVSVDLVPAFIFGKKDWPGRPFRENPITTKDEFLVVPKDPPSVRQASNNSWRLSFQEQEKEVINGKNGLKDTIRLLKLLRTRQFQETTLASYYIKTVMMWLKDCVDDTFWLNPRSYIFMMGLKYFSKLLKRGEIPYYWNPNYNLLIAANPKTIENCSNRIDKIIKTLENNISSQQSPDIKTTLFDFMGISKQILGISEEPGQKEVLLNSAEGGAECLLYSQSSDIFPISEDLVARKIVTYTSASRSLTKVPNTSNERDVLYVTPKTLNVDESENRPSMWKTISEYEAVGVNVMRKLEKMNGVQAFYAEKLIHEILMKGVSNELTASTNVNDEVNELTASTNNLIKEQPHDIPINLSSEWCYILKPLSSSDK